ncbi:MAG: TIGR03936 family radical SAM-associated protein [bacterium]|nr:TIGR03936 family radical SAM-associated protein [bacterium]
MGKEGTARWISHLDLVRAVERALRRARVPLALSQGYNPLPKLSFASALSLGNSSEAEYFDVELTQRMDPAAFHATLSAQMPDGLAIRETREVPPNGPALAARLNLASYRVTVCVPDEAARDALKAAAGRILASPSLVIPRRRKGKTRFLDVRPLIQRLEVAGDGDTVEMVVDLRLDPRGTVKPEEVAGLLAGLASLELPSEAVRVHRTGLYRQDGERLRLPWELY